MYLFFHCAGICDAIAAEAIPAITSRMMRTVPARFLVIANAEHVSSFFEIPSSAEVFIACSTRLSCCARFDPNALEMGEGRGMAVMVRKTIRTVARSGNSFTPGDCGPRIRNRHAEQNITASAEMVKGSIPAARKVIAVREDVRMRK